LDQQRDGIRKGAVSFNDKFTLTYYTMEAKPSQAKPSQAKPSQAKPSQA
jgi:hypothetical protein